MFNNKIAPKNSSSAAVKKYCKVCHDAGKSETEYTSHYIRADRDPLSKVVCPTLLSLDCRYCSKKGHTVKYCKILEKDKIAEARQSKSSIKNTKPKSLVCKVPANMFSSLESDSEDEQEVKKVKKDDDLVCKVPANMFSNLESDSEDDDLVFRAPAITTNTKSYASALLRPAITSKEVKITLPIPIISINRKINDFVPSYNNIKSTYIKNKSWADTDSDSDSELEEEKEKKEEKDKELVIDDYDKIVFVFDDPDNW